ncbi:MAG: sigma-54-dependent Fis family transcriptional regulator [Deltaproteobacteria bacterium]|nr:sigma-54-dependent Fis family transcriptional regulator [Deltaproteobacteria bacterium]MBW2050327.1 sigma-54-dependent Fis family transcriptional regulator [Deltaproteobacteria bacterium]MBW2353608.1 sigma-54-dependent Fis family transcriptional regulator [Deltaproteobacteria bacterium]HDZ89317.1 sigma-54-dependent Fis family transcriptional regulator [Deltaproteobacteria bacterium]
MKDNPRNLIVRDGVLPSHVFAEEIRASWERCFRLGLDPFDRPRLDSVNERDLAQLREQNDLVRRFALLEMRNLQQQIAGSNFIIIFANSDGVILDEVPADPGLTGRTGSKTAPGNIWSEDIKGTNALGLVSSSHEPRTVHGSEHYFEGYSDLTCAAAPIFDACGRMAGIIDATSDCRSRQQHTLALVKMSCLTIENSLFRNRFMEELIIEFHSRHEFLGTLHSGMLAFRLDGSLVRPNRQANFLLQGIPLLPEKTHFNEIFYTPFHEFLHNLRNSLLVNLTDIKGSSFAVKAFNFHPRRFYYVSPDPSKKPLKQSGMVCDDPAVEVAVKMVERAAQGNAAILIRGETGTGKELLARHAHVASGRKGDFVGVNCAALTETLIESELFGYADGAFTGAMRGGAVGLVRKADRGTLFLDEIGVMPLQFQVKLLRFLDRMQIRPVGATEDIQLDIQLVSASNSDLAQAIEAGEFRSDLFYRINAVEAVLPPLRERSDFKVIVRAILDSLDRPLLIEEEAVDLLETYAWPGNIRELKNFLTRLSILIDEGQHGISVKNVQPLLQTLPSGTGSGTKRGNLAEQEREIILSAYARHRGNISAVARELGISRNKVYKKLKEARP